MAGTTSAAADTTSREIVVLYDDARVGLPSLEATLTGASVRGVRGRSLRRAVRAGSGGRLSAVTFRVADTATETRAVTALRQVRGVSHAARNRRWQTRGAPRDAALFEEDLEMPSVLQQAALDQIGAGGSGGDGVTVAVLDGGFDLGHEMLDGHLDPSGGYDTLDGDLDPEDTGDGVDGDGDGLADDMVGHGTFVSGLVLAVAPEAQVLPLRVLDDEGWGTDLALWLGISKAVDEGADVVNLSMVVPSLPQPLQDEIDAARSAGVVFITAAGNERTGPFDDPALVTRALVVGGVDGNDAVLSWSPIGGDVEVYAPAEELKGPLGGLGSDAYGTWSGTSFACALASGAAALLLDIDGTLTPAEVESVLATETVTVSGYGTNGRLEIPAAIDAVD
jgi:subtilisin family serine protease